VIHGNQLLRRAASIVMARFLIMVTALVAVGLILTYFGPAAGIRDWELSINESLATSRSDRLESLARTISTSGDTLPIIAFASAIAIVLACARRWVAMAFIPLALLIEVSTFGAVNFIVRRPRPDVENVGKVPSTFSYPSGHVAATLVCWFGLAIVLLVYKRRWSAYVVVAIGSVAVLAMAWARVYLGMHHPLDVTGGVVMGAGSLLVAARALCLVRDGSNGGSAGVFFGRADGDCYDGHREHRPGDPQESSAGDDAEQHDHGVKFERAPVDERSEHIVV
jgi:membrane-associated phospholipid phosphatase